MKFIVKLFPEISIKSRSVRLRFIKILTVNIRNIIKYYDQSVTVLRYWDHIELQISNTQLQEAIAEALTRIPGIHHILAVEERCYQDIHDIYEKTMAMNRSRLEGKSFCVRVKRRGKHTFTSKDIESYVGGGLHLNIANARVQLTHPEETVLLEIIDNRLILITNRYEGIGGFPIGTQGDVLSLISGGFDSGVSSYMLIRRGCRVNYCFFNLGGIAHELGVRQVADHLWKRYSSSHKVRFISIDFAPVVNEILKKINKGEMGVVLKRMMVRSASAIAQRYGIQALLTGEALGQVSSQTLTNLNLIDKASATLILRPLIAHDKENIITLARQIGTEKFATNMPEYCGIVSKKPTVRAVKSRIEEEENHFDFTVLEEVQRKAKILDIRDVISQNHNEINEIETTGEFSQYDVILDIRTQDEQESRPLKVDNITVQILPFYKLNTLFTLLDQTKSYLLYCDHGVMSRLQALCLREQGFKNVKVYVPFSSVHEWTDEKGT